MKKKLLKQVRAEAITIHKALGKQIVNGKEMQHFRRLKRLTAKHGLKEAVTHYLHVVLPWVANNKTENICDGNRIVYRHASGVSIRINDDRIKADTRKKIQDALFMERKRKGKL